MIMNTSSASAAILALAAFGASAALAPMCAQAAPAQPYVEVAGARILSQAQLSARTIALTIAFDYRSIAPTFSVFGWSVAADPARGLEFIELAGVSSQGLSMSGSGTTSVSTPPLFAAGQAVSVAVNGATTKVIATPEGRISFTVDLGPANSAQQYRIGTITSVASASIGFAQH